MKLPRNGSLRESLFRIGVLLKGLDALLEIAGGIAVWLVNPVVVVHYVALLTQDETSTNSQDLVVRFLHHEAQRILFVSKHFVAVYLLGHGIAKAFVVIALMRNKLWAYPVAIVVFGAFIVYQTYRSIVTDRLGLIALTVLDVIVVILIWLEYRARKQGASHPR